MSRHYRLQLKIIRLIKCLLKIQNLFVLIFSTFVFILYLYTLLNHI